MTLPFIIAAAGDKRVAKRSLDELLGLAAGVVADGYVSDQEIAVITRWAMDHAHLSDQWPANVLFARLELALQDGLIDEEERSDIMRICAEMAVGIAPGTKATEAKSAVSPLPFDDPPPTIVFSSKAFVLTGEFASGRRSLISESIRQAGGVVHDGVKKDTDFLVVGGLGNEHWAHASFGNKIRKAVEYRERGIRIAIVPERLWLAAMGS